MSEPMTPILPDGSLADEEIAEIKSRLDEIHAGYVNDISKLLSELIRLLRQELSAANLNAANFNALAAGQEDEIAALRFRCSALERERDEARGSAETLAVGMRKETEHRCEQARLSGFSAGIEAAAKVADAAVNDPSLARPDSVMHSIRHNAQDDTATSIAEAIRALHHKDTVLGSKHTTPGER